MTSAKPMTISESAAKTLLAAWTSGDVTLLRFALTHTESLSTDQLPPFEEEVIDLLQGIASMMRLRTEQEGSAAEMDVPVGLLRHLAQSAGSARFSDTPQFGVPTSLVN